MVVPKELDDPHAGRGGARDPDRDVHGLAPGAPEDAELRGWDEPADRLGELGFERMGGSVSEPRAELLPHRVEHDGGRMAQQERSEAEPVIDVGVAVEVVDARALPAHECDRQRQLARAEGRGDASRQELARTLVLSTGEGVAVAHRS